MQENGFFFARNCKKWANNLQEMAKNTIFAIKKNTHLMQK